MNRYYVIKDEVYHILNTDCSKSNRQEAIEHLSNVANMAVFLAKMEKLDLELAAIIGILHDLAAYKFNSHFDHANRSSMLAKNILTNSKLFTNDEIILIVTAIKNHSFKEKKDDDYSELIKNADLLVQHLNDPNAIFSIDKQLRLENIFNSLQKLQ